MFLLKELLTFIPPATLGTPRPVPHQFLWHLLQYLDAVFILDQLIDCRVALNNDFSIFVRYVLYSFHPHLIAPGIRS